MKKMPGALLCATITLTGFAQKFPSGIYTSEKAIVSHSPSISLPSELEMKSIMGSKKKIKHKDSGTQYELYTYRIKMDKSALKKRLKKEPPAMISVGGELYISEGVVDDKKTFGRILAGNIFNSKSYVKVTSKGKNLVFPVSSLSHTVRHQIPAGAGPNSMVTVGGGTQITYIGAAWIDTTTGEVTRVINKKDMENVLTRYPSLAKRFSEGKQKRNTATFLYFASEVSKLQRK